jgi:hypothetical protein
LRLDLDWAFRGVKLCEWSYVEAQKIPCHNVRIGSSSAVNGYSGCALSDGFYKRNLFYNTDIEILEFPKMKNSKF